MRRAHWRTVRLAESNENSPLSDAPPTSGREETVSAPESQDRFDLRDYFSIEYDFVTDRLRVSRPVSEDEFRRVCMEASQRGGWEDAVTLAVVASTLGYEEIFRSVYTPDVVDEMVRREGENRAVQALLAPR